MLRLVHRLMTTIDTSSAVFKDTIMAYRSAPYAESQAHRREICRMVDRLWSQKRPQTRAPYAQF